EQNVNESKELYRFIRNTGEISLELFKKIVSKNIKHFIEIGVGALSCLDISKPLLSQITFPVKFFLDLFILYIISIYNKNIYVLEIAKDHLVLLETPDRIILYPKKYEQHIKYLTDHWDLKFA